MIKIPNMQRFYLRNNRSISHAIVDSCTPSSSCLQSKVSKISLFYFDNAKAFALLDIIMHTCFHVEEGFFFTIVNFQFKRFTCKWNSINLMFQHNHAIWRRKGRSRLGRGKAFLLFNASVFVRLCINFYDDNKEFNVVFGEVMTP